MLGTIQVGHAEEARPAGSVKMDYMSTLTGDSSIVINGDDPKKRAELAKHVTELLRSGYAILLQDGEKAYRIKGYDAETNEWIITKAGGRKKAADTTVNTVPQRPGG
ncbi:hypothetical protein A2765_05805 [Candidatus Kaiserbacteria bacterium RIFCSPHIGHO2_01_FULL_56_24]|uniref:Uncharacterized protein n=1 Tax=Candidatus Kaiserbacteria bacterium RIFCSPHIGHO2_01_FULL_56_24 TaxID=1798487 RepID=A0A1F6DAG8_9BACT|nr:MAG: hypothetical protein A2765_05805 [Candidatus Kaiserbacteria bacterium RIFCSPHIGHO2_01_FULL_56_24]